MNREFRLGERVKVLATGKLGSVVYATRFGPDFKTIRAYSIALDDRLADPKYVGSIFPAEALVAVDEVSS